MSRESLSIAYAAAQLVRAQGNAVESQPATFLMKKDNLIMLWILSRCEVVKRAEKVVLELRGFDGYIDFLWHIYLKHAYWVGDSFMADINSRLLRNLNFIEELKTLNYQQQWLCCCLCILAVNIERYSHRLLLLPPYCERELVGGYIPEIMRAFVTRNHGVGFDEGNDVERIMGWNGDHALEIERVLQVFTEHMGFYSTDVVDRNPSFTKDSLTRYMNSRKNRVTVADNKTRRITRIHSGYWGSKKQYEYQLEDIMRPFRALLEIRQSVLGIYKEEFADGCRRKGFYSQYNLIIKSNFPLRMLEETKVSYNGKDNEENGTQNLIYMSAQEAGKNEGYKILCMTLRGIECNSDLIRRLYYFIWSKVRANHAEFPHDWYVSSHIYCTMSAEGLRISTDSKVEVGCYLSDSLLSRRKSCSRRYFRSGEKDARMISEAEELIEYIGSCEYWDWIFWRQRPRFMVTNMMYLQREGRAIEQYLERLKKDERGLRLGQLEQRLERNASGLKKIMSCLDTWQKRLI